MPLPEAVAAVVIGCPCACWRLAALNAQTAASSVAVVGPKATPAPNEMAIAAVMTRRKTRTSTEYPAEDEEGAAPPWEEESLAAMAEGKSGNGLLLTKI